MFGQTCLSRGEILRENFRTSATTKQPASQQQEEATNPSVAAKLSLNVNSQQQHGSNERRD